MTGTSSTSVEVSEWVDICAAESLIIDRGVCARVGDEQVAIFRVSPADSVYAISNFDPFSGAYVLSRGIVGTAGDVAVVASPMYKQHFELATGQCIERDDVSVASYPVEVVDGRVRIALR